MSAVPFLPPEIISHIIRHAQPPHYASRESRERVFQRLALVTTTWYSSAREEFNRWLYIDLQRPEIFSPYTVRTIGNLLDLGRVRFVEVDHPWEEEMPEGLGDDDHEETVRANLAGCYGLQELWYCCNRNVSISALVTLGDVNTSARLMSFLTNFPSMYIILEIAKRIMN